MPFVPHSFSKKMHLTCHCDKSLSLSGLSGMLVCMLIVVETGVLKDETGDE
jgi:hypothetical protein